MVKRVILFVSIASVLLIGFYFAATFVYDRIAHHASLSSSIDQLLNQLIDEANKTSTNNNKNIHDAAATTTATQGSKLPSSSSNNNNNNKDSFMNLILKQHYLFLVTGLLGVLTSILSIFYWMFNQIQNYVKKQFVTSISLNNSDDAFTWLMTYLGNQHTLYHNMLNGKQEKTGSAMLDDKLEASFLTAPSLVAQMVRIKRMNYWSQNNFDDGQAVHVQYTPEDGFHIFRFRGKFFWFSKSKSNDSVSTGYDKNSSFSFESLSLNMFGTMKSMSNRQILLDLFEEAMKSTMANSSDVVRIYVAQQWGGWTLALAKNKRPFGSVILDKDLAEKLSDDAVQFLKRKEWYREKGIPFRRGYLLYGLPGTGKSSFVSALASRLNLNICVLDLSSGLIGDEELAQRMQSAPPRSVILLEDIDAVFTNRNTPDANKNKRSVTFAGLLNSIDGIAAPESGRLLFMTTNHIERLDPALIRPGRCDVKVEFTYATRQQMKGAFLHFYKNATEEQAERFCVALETEGEQLTMAQILSHLSRFKRDPEGSIENVKDGFIKRIRQYTLEERNISAVTIEEWLKRLGFARQIQAFKKNRVKTVLDLGAKPSTQLFTQNGVSASADISRITGVLSNEKAAMADFQLVTPAEVKRLFKFHFVDVPDVIVKRFVGSVSKLDISFMELKQFLNIFKQRYYTSTADKRVDVLEELLSKVDEHLINPPNHHLEVPSPQDLINIYTGEVCSKLDENTDLFDYCPKKAMQKAKDWILDLNNEYKWWTEESPPVKKESTTNGTEDSEAGEDKPEGLETIFSVFEEECIETVKDLLSISGDCESTWEEKFKIKAKGRRLRIVRRVKEIQKIVDDFGELQKKWAELFEAV